MEAFGERGKSRDGLTPLELNSRFWGQNAWSRSMGLFCRSTTGESTNDCGRHTKPLECLVVNTQEFVDFPLCPLADSRVCAGRHARRAWVGRVPVGYISLLRGIFEFGYVQVVFVFSETRVNFDRGSRIAI